MFNYLYLIISSPPEVQSQSRRIQQSLLDSKGKTLEGNVVSRASYLKVTWCQVSTYFCCLLHHDPSSGKHALCPLTFSIRCLLLQRLAGSHKSLFRHSSYYTNPSLNIISKTKKSSLKVLGRSLMIGWRKNSWNPERVPTVVSFVSVRPSVSLYASYWSHFLS